MQGLDGRHRDRDGRIQKKRSDTKMKNLKREYPELSLQLNVRPIH
jgi:hypothetical protein